MTDLEAVIYGALMHHGKPKNVADFERAARTVAEMLERRQAAAPSPTVGDREADLERWLEAYWDAGYAEGKTGDNEADRANEALHNIRKLFRAAKAQLAEPGAREALAEIVRVMGPKASPCCDGCQWEWNEALRIARDALAQPAAQAEPVARFTLRDVPPISDEALNETIREVKEFSRQRRESDALNPELLNARVGAGPDSNPPAQGAGVIAAQR